jgi:hypothetical protein
LLGDAMNPIGPFQRYHARFRAKRRRCLFPAMIGGHFPPASVFAKEESQGAN